MERSEDTLEPAGGPANLAVGRRRAQERRARAMGLVAPLVEIEVGAIEGHPISGSVGGVVEHPLHQGPHRGRPGLTVGETLGPVVALLPLQYGLSCPGNLGAKLAPKIAGQGAQSRAELDTTKEGAERAVGRVEQIGTDIAQEVQMAGENRNGRLPLRHQLRGGLLHRAAEVAHDGTGTTKASDDLLGRCGRIWSARALGIFQAPRTHFLHPA